MAAPASSGSYLTASLGSLSPWGARTAAPKPPPSGGTAGDGGIGKQQGGDHTIDWKRRIAPARYPPDCPPLSVRWFYAVDVPKRRPLPLAAASKDGTVPPQPKKHVPFSARDSRSIELAFQKCADQEQADRRGSKPSQPPSSRPGQAATFNTTIDDPSGSEKPGKVKVPVNEDYLFDVDIERRELAPVYWLGPVYEVRRGTWFHQEGSKLRPCDENLASQLEEGYLKVNPFRYPPPRPRPTSLKTGEDAKLASAVQSKLSTRAFAEDLNVGVEGAVRKPDVVLRESRDASRPRPAQTYRLFGAHLNSVVTYQDATTAWIVTDDFLSKLSSNVYQRIAGGGYLMGTKVVRGYTDPGKAKAKAKEDSDSEKKTDAATVTVTDEIVTATVTATVTAAVAKASKQESDAEEVDPPPAPEIQPASLFRRAALERKMSNLVSSTEAEDKVKQDEEARKRDEKEISNDYRDEDSEEQDRGIEHLILVTHGIGQRLGLRMESVNFIHDVNVLRKTLKGVYGSSPDLQALNAAVDGLPQNCRVQVLPVCWRHLLDFPRQSVRQNRKEHDLGGLDAVDDEPGLYPSLADITVEGVPAVRSLITDLALDILLYQSSYRDHIAGIVLRECNRIYALFRARNPAFAGQVSLIGHSLGSAILFDILCDQKPAHVSATSRQPDQDLDFEVDSLFCLGSPVGLFQMLKGRTIAGRAAAQTIPTTRKRRPSSMEDPFLGPSDRSSSSSRTNTNTNTNTNTSTSTSTTSTPRSDTHPVELPFSVSSPKCGQLYNIFHPTDPISYRMEPLISPAMAPLRAQPLPYTKKGIFGAPLGQGFTGIGARVGQSVSGLWTSLSSGIASSILNRSLGITSEDGKSLLISSAQRDANVATPGQPLSLGGGTNITSGGVIPITSIPASPTAADDDSKKRKLPTDHIQRGSSESAPQTTEDRQHVHQATLIDAEMETLYAGFEKRRKSNQSGDGAGGHDSVAWRESEERGRRLRREEAKVRALNANGRVDFSIQEGVFDISLIASIASHLSYWADEDVSHFLISQLLARNRVLKR